MPPKKLQQSVTRSPRHSSKKPVRRQRRRLVIVSSPKRFPKRSPIRKIGQILMGLATIPRIPSSPREHEDYIASLEERKRVASSESSWAYQNGDYAKSFEFLKELLKADIALIGTVDYMFHDDLAPLQKYQAYGEFLLTRMMQATGGLGVANLSYAYDLALGAIQELMSYESFGDILRPPRESAILHIQREFEINFAGWNLPKKYIYRKPMPFGYMET